MNLIRHRSVRVVLLLAIVVFIFLQVMFRHSSSKPQEGGAVSYKDYDTGGEIPGDPQQSIQKMKYLYELVEVYRRRNSGNYPADEIPLLSDMASNLKAYGLSKPSDARAAFANPDIRLSDNLTERLDPDEALPYYVKNKRLNGENFGTPKPAGTYDVIATLNLYVHNNTRHRKGELTTNPVGFYLMLLDNGEVIKVPYDQVLYVPIEHNSFLFAYAREAGVPQNALTYDEYFQKQMGWRQGPRGKAGGYGQSYTRQ